MIRKPIRMGLAVVCGILGLCAQMLAETFTVIAKVQMTQRGGVSRSKDADPAQVVVWLSPITPDARAVAPGNFQLVQKNKMFRPHLLVVPVGSQVTFPNLDPFFHNVFSLFNGKRFDLGLYQTGGSKEVRFSHEGVSFIFCNIHPEMSAVIVALATPYFTIAAKDGSGLLHEVPAGTYVLHVWAEGVDSQQLTSMERTITINGTHTDLGLIRIVNDVRPEAHKNKFGQDYTNDPVIY